jgi:hypothetical protein
MKKINLFTANVDDHFKGHVGFAVVVLWGE